MKRMDNGCEERNNLNFFFNIYEKWLSKTEKMGCIIMLE